MGTWVRTFQTNPLTSSNSAILAVVPSGHTCLRIHAGASVRVRGYNTTDPNQLSQFQTGFGIFVAPVAGYSPIFPITTPGDVNPPMQRWLHWRMLYVTPSPPSLTRPGGYWVWHSSPSPWDVDIKAQTLANGGNLNVAISWQPNEALPSGWAASLSYWAAVLYS